MTSPLSFALILIAFAVPASAQTLDWSQDPVAQSAATVKPAAHSYFQGQLTLRGETREICFSLSSQKIDQFEGDPDVSQGVFVSQAIPSFREKSAASTVNCASSLEFNGDYLRTCGGLYLIGAATRARGDIFTQMERYNDDGSLKIQPVGTFEFKRVDGCPKP
jgi:hypothetical protein